MKLYKMQPLPHFKMHNSYFFQRFNNRNNTSTKIKYDIRRELQHQHN